MPTNGYLGHSSYCGHFNDRLESKSTSQLTFPVENKTSQHLCSGAEDIHDSSSTKANLGYLIMGFMSEEGMEGSVHIRLENKCPVCPRAAIECDSPVDGRQAWNFSWRHQVTFTLRLLMCTKREVGGALLILPGQAVLWQSSWLQTGALLELRVEKRHGLHPRLCPGPGVNFFPWQLILWCQFPLVFSFPCRPCSKVCPVHLCCRDQLHTGKIPAGSGIGPQFPGWGGPQEMCFLDKHPTTEPHTHMLPDL